MRRQTERGFSIAEVLVATAISGILSAGVLTMVSSTTRNYSKQQAQNDAVWQGRAAIDLMLREFRMAGYPSKSNYATSTGITPANSNLVASPFITATATDVVFEADLDGNGIAERVEYRLSGTTFQRSDVPKNADGSVPAANYQTVVTNVANGASPIFIYTVDPYSTVTPPGNTNRVRIVLILQTATPDPTNRQYRTYQFEGVAYRENPDH